MRSLWRVMVMPELEGEAIPLGIRGIMPGVSIADLLNDVFQARRKGDSDRAYRLFGMLLPYIAFSLTNLELSHTMEKRLLVRRGIIASNRVRSLSLRPSASAIQHMEFLLDKMMQLVSVSH